jgi:hypothetical protein
MAMINLLHGLFVHQGVTRVVKKVPSRPGQREEAIQQLSGQEREEAE